MASVSLLPTIEEDSVLSGSTDSFSVSSSSTDSVLSQDSKVNRSCLGSIVGLFTNLFRSGKKGSKAKETELAPLRKGYEYAIANVFDQVLGDTSEKSKATHGAFGDLKGIPGGPKGW